MKWKLLVSVFYTVLSLPTTEWYNSSLSYWPFESFLADRVIRDWTGNNNGKLNGTVRSVNGIVGSAIELTGKYSWIDFGLLPETCLNEPEACSDGFTIAFWLKLPTFVGNRIIVQLGQNRHSRGFTVWTRRKKEKKINFSVIGKDRSFHSMLTWPTVHWTHVSLIWRKTEEELDIYFNCTLYKRVTTWTEKKAAKLSKVTLMVGASHGHNKNAHMLMDEFAIWNRTLTKDEICRVVDIKTVHGGYSSWSSFSKCNKTCGNETQVRHRQCNNPAPQNRGRNCSELGPEYEEKPCNNTPCPIDGGYAQWSAFTQCTKSCGSGEKYRGRLCNNPKPQYGGLNCSRLGISYESHPCNEHPCPVDGGFTQWSDYSECSRSCGNGTQFRYRNCTNPAPAHGGKNCSILGIDFIVRPCNTHICPIDGGYTEWSNFTECSKSCGSGTKFRTRNCSNPYPQFRGKNCSVIGPAKELVFCNTRPCPIDGGYTAWTEFSNCSKPCGNGTKFRSRNCTNPSPQHGGKNCSRFGAKIEILFCNVHYCSIDGGYSMWSNFTECSLSCGGGVRTRNRTCTNPVPMYGGQNCSHFGPNHDSQDCNTDPCPIHGGFTSWSNFTSCSKTCGNGTRIRTRTCTSPAPKYGGKNCTGKFEEIEDCNMFPCPVDGGYTRWSNYSECSKPCGIGEKNRYRNCTNPVPQHGGKSCDVLGPPLQIKACNTHPCPIDGGYTHWTNFTECSKSCGNGTSNRTRSCTNPVPRYGGRNCSRYGSSFETRYCNVHPCPINGGYTPWSNFTDCTKSCGNGTKTRFRNCTNPTPRYGGSNCSHLGPDFELLYCNEHYCPIDGGYTHWTNFTECSKSCGNGTSNRTRSCTNPVPRYGGRNCSRYGSSFETRYCNVHPCPINGGYTPWSNFTDCTKSCGNGTKTRFRNCTNPTPRYGGSNCSHLGPDFELLYCNEHYCPIDGGYTHWTNFTECSKSCGNGTSNRTRSCTNPVPQYGGKNCSRYGSSFETRYCNVHPCPIDGGYTPWSNFTDCTKSCGNGTKTRFRNCTNPTPRYGGSNCSHLGPDFELLYCNEHYCPIDGGYTHWTNFTECSKSCGNGTSNRTRSCTNPVPQYGGKDCSRYGSSFETRYCNVHPCPIDGGYTPWSNFTDCTKSCGNGTKTRFRNCTNPTPRYGGNNCSHLGPDFELLYCNEHYCPIDGGYSSWTNYTACSKSCGNGTKSKTRTCDNPKPQHDGQNCSRIGPAIHIVPCNIFPCPIHGNYSTWSEFTPCDKTCNNGTRFRTRKCIQPVPQFGGRNCSSLGPDMEVVECFLKHCPIDGGYSNWSEFGPCSKSCNTGIKNRTRLCNSPEPKFGGKTCDVLGAAMEATVCNTHPCPIHGGYTEWTEFSSCSTTCEGGVRVRTRNCSNPSPMYGGRNCSELGPSISKIMCNTQRCPDIVFNITINLTDEVWTESLAHTGSEESKNLYADLQYGIINIYFDTRRKISGFNVSFRKGSVIADIIIKYFNELYDGITVLHDAIYMTGRLGGHPVKPISLATVDVPARSPTGVSGYNTSSTSILLTWNPVDNEYTNGNLTSYRITYRQLGKQYIHQRETRTPHQLSFEVSGLERFTNYEFRVAGRNKRGVGLDSQPIAINTDQDRPLQPPPSVSGFNKSSTSVLVSWSAIPREHIPGFLKGYQVYYRPFNQKAANTNSTAVGPDTRDVLLTNLDKYTKYEIKICGYTIKGEGPTAMVYVTTDEDVPTKTPQKVQANNESSTSIHVQWEPIPKGYVHGFLRGYVVSYSENPPLDHWLNVTLKSDVRSTKIKGLRKYTKYAVQVQGFTSKGYGKISKFVELKTDQDKPERYPLNLTGFNKSSTELYIEWQPLEAKYWNGKELGYKIFYIPLNAASKYKKTAIVDAHSNFTTLDQLGKFTWYKVKVAAFTSKGLGPISPEIVLQTSEDVPSKAVIDVKARHSSHTSLFVQWKSIPKGYIHGVLRGFRIHYWETNKKPKKIQTKGVSPDARSTELSDLLIYTVYAIEIIGFTSVGNGAVSRITYARTDEYTPGAPPVNLRAANKTSPTMITVSWGPIANPYDVHGILRGYRVFYTAVAVSTQPFHEPKPKLSVTLKDSQTSVVLRNLSPFTRYHIFVLAFTAKGNGVKSPIIVAETCNCHRTLYTNWWASPPYVETPGSLNKSGIIPQVLEGAVRTCCQTCAEFGTTSINYTFTVSKKSAMKEGLQEFRENIDDAEFSFPVYGFMDQRVYSGSYGFAPLVSSPGVALIVIGDEEGAAARMLIKSIMLCWPIVFLDIMLLWVLSIVIWFVETFSNSRHFPHNMLQGTWEGMWWAFASMTTLGYGDRIPRTPIGRIICIVWILIGVILIACFNSTMTSILTARILDKDIMLYGTKIAAIQNSSEYRLGVRKNARVNPNGKKYSNLDEIYKALVNREVKGVLIDAYTVGSKKELFERKELRISKIYDFSSAYGVVLGGESKKLQTCFHSYLSEQRSFVSDVIRKNTKTIEVKPKTVSVERSQGLFDASFPTYTKTVIICSTVLALILVVGAKFECAKKIGWITFKPQDKSKQYKPPTLEELRSCRDELRREMSIVVQVFILNCKRRAASLRMKHLKELQHLAKLKKEYDYSPLEKGAFTKHNLWNITYNKKGNGFTSSLIKKAEQSNGHSNGFSFPKRFKKNKEVETIV